MSDYVLAADGGGTKTQVWCADTNGNLVGEGFAGPTSLTAVSVGASSLNLLEGIRQATEKLPVGWQVQKMAMGVAGLDTPHEEEETLAVFQEALSYLNIKKIMLVNDVVIALHSGSAAANAMAIVSGTGSNCYGQNEQHEQAKVGGMDFLLGDEGSGYAIGRDVLRAAVRSYDGRGAKSLLEKLVDEHFQVKGSAELKNSIYHPPISKMEVAELSKVCAAAFLAGDATAKTILDKAVSDLAEMAETVLKRLNLLDQKTDCVLVGGVFKIDYLREELMKKLLTICPQVNIVLPQQPPVSGALKLALKND